jgi:alpha-galactosidase
MKFRLPDETKVVLSDTTVTLSFDLCFDGGYVKYDVSDSLSVKVKSEKQGISFIYLRWNEKLDQNVKVLGDAWERGYGDLEWKAIDKDRNMPWYMAISNGSDSNINYNGRLTQCFGVGVLPNAFAMWNCDEDGVTLCLDVRNGCLPVQLGKSELDVANVFFREYNNVIDYALSLGITNMYYQKQQSASEEYIPKWDF